MLLLIFSNRNELCLIEKNIRCHKHRVGEQSGVGRKSLGDLIFVTVSAFQKSYAGHVAEIPHEFHDFGNIRLFIENSGFGIKTACEEVNGKTFHAFPEIFCFGRSCKRVEVSDENERFAHLLKFQHLTDRPEEVSDVGNSGGLNTGKDTFHTQIAPFFTQITAL